jgi:pimeloyl-ACP methyl ester carboxylesterase
MVQCLDCIGDRVARSLVRPASIDRCKRVTARLTSGAIADRSLDCSVPQRQSGLLTAGVPGWAVGSRGYELGSLGVRTVVLVHGAWHGPWCWAKVTPRLAAAGVPHAEVELPFTGHDDDIAATRAALDRIDGTKVLVGHSYGGLVISGAGKGRSDVAQVVYLCAFLVQPGETIIDELARVPDLPTAKVLDAIVLHDDGTSSIDPDHAVAAFYSLSSTDAARDAIGRLRPMNAKSIFSRCQGAPWMQVPSTYVLCDQDQAIPVKGQRRMARSATNVVVLDTDHSPFLSMPEETARILVNLASDSS